MFDDELFPPNAHYHTLSDKQKLDKLEQITLFNGKVYAHLLDVKKTLMQDGLLIEDETTQYIIPYNQISIVTLI
jgi:hypothetical protein